MKKNRTNQYGSDAYADDEVDEVDLSNHLKGFVRRMREEERDLHATEVAELKANADTERKRLVEALTEKEQAVEAARVAAKAVLTNALGITESIGKQERRAMRVRPAQLGRCVVVFSRDRYVMSQLRRRHRYPLRSRSHSACGQ